MKYSYWALFVFNFILNVGVHFVSGTKGTSQKIGNNYERIVVIILDNQDYDVAASDSYISSIPLKHNGIVLSNYYALQHPGQPNYIGMISGSTNGVNFDLDSNINRRSVVDLLEAKNISWKAYQEDYPGECKTISSIKGYRRKRNPFISFTNIANNSSRCAKIVSGYQLDKDIEEDTVPQVVFYMPNIENSGHDTSLAYSSAWLENWLEPRIDKTQFSENTLFVLTWSQNKAWLLQKNRVLTILFGPALKRSAKIDGVAYNHYSILKSIEENWNLGDLGQEDKSATALIVRDQAENGASEKIKNVVLLVMENRSFDRMMGYFKYSKEIDGLDGTEFNYIDPQNPKSRKIYATNKGLLKDPRDPPHEHYNVTLQITGDPNITSDSNIQSAPMSGFVSSFAKTFPDIADNDTALHQAIDAFSPESIPITYELASNYTIMDRFFSSFPGSTMPNRLFVHSATSHGELYTDDKTKWMKGYPQRTIYSNLEDAGIEWRNYYTEVPSLLVFQRHRLSALDNFRNWAAFKSDAANGRLPPVSVVDPAYFSIPKCIPESDNHPPADVAEGEKLLKEIYETLRASPQWENMLFIVTYDEHGGYYDHVPTPLQGVPNPDGKVTEGFKFNRLGVRVPTILISPWVKKGGVIHRAEGPTETSEYELSSIPATIKKLFNLPHFLTKRDAWAGTFENAISLDKPRSDCPKVLSEPPPPVEAAPRLRPLETIVCNLFKAIIQGL